MARYTCLWVFRVEADKVREFEQHYGADGTWVALFRQAPGYLGTLLLRDRDEPTRYVTVDRWESHEAYRAFRERFAAEYRSLDARCEHLTREERALGEYTEVPH